MNTHDNKPKKPRMVRTNIELPTVIVPVYAGVRVGTALDVIKMDMDLYKGVKLAEVLEAIYEQGCKDGARAAFEQLDKVKKLVPHKNPGRPSK